MRGHRWGGSRSIFCFVVSRCSGLLDEMGFLGVELAGGRDGVGRQAMQWHENARWVEPDGIGTRNVDFPRQVLMVTCADGLLGHEDWHRWGRE